MNDTASDDRPLFDERMASRLLGKRMLVGITYVDREGEPIRREQFHGVVASVSATKGIELRLQGANDGAVRWLPPDLSSTSVAAPGEYRIKNSQEIVSNPDFLVTWKVCDESTPEAGEC